MRMHYAKFGGLALGVATLAGCELIVDFDRSLIDASAVVTTDTGPALPDAADGGVTVDADASTAPEASPDATPDAVSDASADVTPALDGDVPDAVVDGGLQPDASDASQAPDASDAASE